MAIVAWFERSFVSLTRLPGLAQTVVLQRKLASFFNLRSCFSFSVALHPYNPYRFQQ